MSNLSRKLARNELKQELGNNRIKEKWHYKDITLEEMLKQQEENKYGKKHNRAF